MPISSPGSSSAPGAVHRSASCRSPMKANCGSKSTKKCFHAAPRWSLGHVSNALGTVNPVKLMIEMAHQHGAAVVVDGAQAVAHVDVNVQDLDCDFYAFSGHKVFG